MTAPCTGVTRVSRRGSNESGTPATGCVTIKKGFIAVSEYAVEQLREAVGYKVTDPFQNGDMIRWKDGGRYTYAAAIKTPVGWITTVRISDSYVSHTYDYEDFVEMLATSDTSEIQVAVEWKEVQ